MNQYHSLKPIHPLTPSKNVRKTVMLAMIVTFIAPSNLNHSIKMISSSVVPQTSNAVKDNNDLWFQGDSATCNTAEETMILIAENFPKSSISIRSEVNRDLATTFYGDIL